jgi:hypothetical protein
MTKGRLKRFIENSLFILGIGGGSFLGGMYTVCMQEIKPRYDREQIEEIVNSVNTPRHAFEHVADNITFPRDELIYETYPGKCCRRWYSLQESYTIKRGVCIDGAIAFAALLSDNPEYEAKVILVEGHAFNSYIKNKKLSYVSFNDGKGWLNNSYFDFEKYDSLKELMSKEFSNYEDYLPMEIDPEKLKFGKGIWGTWEELKYLFEWKDIKKEKSE